MRVSLQKGNAFSFAASSAVEASVHWSDALNDRDVAAAAAALLIALGVLALSEPIAGGLNPSADA